MGEITGANVSARHPQPADMALSRLGVVVGLPRLALPCLLPHERESAFCLASPTRASGRVHDDPVGSALQRRGLGPATMRCIGVVFFR